MVYFDYNATTPLAPEVIQAIDESMRDGWGNPSSSHQPGLNAKNIITTARKHVATMVGAKPSDIIFTSGGTEGNNWILNTAVEHFHKALNSQSHSHGDFSHSKVKVRPHFVSCNIEHDSIKLVLEHFQSEGIADVTFVPVSHSTGKVDVSSIVSAICPNTIMISVMLANNETGVIQDVAEICQKVKAVKRVEGETERIFIHTDAAQAIGKIPVDVLELGVDYLTIVGHKFYAPRIGAIYALNPGEGTPLYPVLFGGGQERNFRPGTENTPMIAGLGKAAELVCNNLDQYQSHMLETRNYLEHKLTLFFGGSVRFNGRFDGSERLPNTCNVSFIHTGLKGHEILAKVPAIEASVGAACHAQDRPSHILKALGIPDKVAWRALRISVGRETTKADIDFAVKELHSILS